MLNWVQHKILKSGKKGWLLENLGAHHDWFKKSDFSLWIVQSTFSDRILMHLKLQVVAHKSNFPGTLYHLVHTLKSSDDYCAHV